MKMPLKLGVSFDDCVADNAKKPAEWKKASNVEAEPNDS
jgi:hypothetical protein